MRVRIGKSIKAKSLLGQCNIPYSYTDANIIFYPLNTGTFGRYTTDSITKFITRTANHKYFLFLKTDIVYSWSYFGIWDTYSTGYNGNRAVPVKDGNNYYALISPVTSAENGVPMFQFGDTQNLPSIAYYAVILDLTEIGLDNLTAQQFYNKYKNKLELLATGQEIILDDKSGRTNIKSRLPDEYQRIEYIYQEKQGASGTTNLAYIQSNFSFADIDAAEFDISISESGGVNANIVLCAYDTSYYIVVDRSLHRVNGFSSITWNPESQSLFSDGLRHKIKVSNLSSSNTTKIRTAWDWTWWHKTYWYGLKLFKNNEVIQDFIPCYRKSDGVIGMYDVITKQFFTNQGTGIFLKGSNVVNNIGGKPHITIEGTTNLGGTSVNYSNQEYGKVYDIGGWGGDKGTITYYPNGGYNNYPYKVYHKTATGTGGIYHKTDNDIQIEAGKTYTMSVYVKASRNFSDAAYSFNINRGSDNRYITYNKSVPFTTEWKRISRTFTATEADAGMYGEMSIIYNDDETDYYVYYSGFQIEEKDHATPFVIGTRPDNTII